MRSWTRRRFGATALAAALLAGGPALAAGNQSYAGMTLNLASMNDPFATVLVKLAPEFQAATGITVKVDVLSYPELLTKVTADFIGNTKGYDLVTTDNVWSGQFAEAGHTVVLDDWIKRDSAELQLDDIYPVVMSSLGNYQGKQVAFPFAGYANVLAIRKDLYGAAGLEAPATMEAMIADAGKLTDKPKNVYGWVANGQKGPAVAQDWMQYNAQLGPRPTSPAWWSTRSCSTRPRRPAPSTTTGAAARNPSARAWSPTCRPGRSAPRPTTTPTNRRWRARSRSCWRRPASTRRRTTASAAGASASMPTSTPITRRQPGSSSNGSPARRCRRRWPSSAAAASSARARRTTPTS